MVGIILKKKSIIRSILIRREKPKLNRGKAALRKLKRKKRQVASRQEVALVKEREKIDAIN